MVVLEFLLDAINFDAQAKRVEGSLKGISDEAKKTQATVTSALNRNFQATTGITQIASGVASTAQAFQSLNLAAAGFVGARTLLEIGQTASQMALLRAGTGAASGAFLALGRAIPYVGVALSVAAAGMALFGNETRNAASSFDQLVAAMEKARIQQNLATRLGVPGGGFDRATELRRLFAAAEYIDTADVFAPGAAGRGISVADLQELLGDRSRSGLTDDLMRYPGLSDQTRQQLYFGLPAGAGISELGNFGNIQLSRDEAFGFVRSRYNRMSIDPTTGAPYGAGGYDVPISPELAEHTRQIEAAMQRAAEYAAQIGATLGGVLWDMLAGAQGLRQTVVSLINQLGRQGFSSLSSNFFSTLPQLFGGGPSTPPGPGGNPVGGGAYINP